MQLVELNIFLNIPHFSVTLAIRLNFSSTNHALVNYKHSTENKLNIRTKNNSKVYVKTP